MSRIEQLPIPYTAVATDLLTGKSVWLQRGPVDEAIRASIAIPGVIAPHVVDGRLLADGGILDPLPMAPIAAVNADLTIAVSLSGSETLADSESESRLSTDWLNRMLRSTSALFDNASRPFACSTGSARRTPTTTTLKPNPKTTNFRRTYPTRNPRCPGWAVSR